MKIVISQLDPHQELHNAIIVTERATASHTALYRGSGQVLEYNVDGALDIAVAVVDEAVERRRAERREHAEHRSTHVGALAHEPPQHLLEHIGANRSTEFVLQ